MIHLWLLTPAGALSFSFHEEETEEMDSDTGDVQEEEGAHEEVDGKKDLVLWLMRPESN